MSVLIKNEHFEAKNGHFKAISERFWPQNVASVSQLISL
jgi:hypothetical protein